MPMSHDPFALQSLGARGGAKISHAVLLLDIGAGWANILFLSWPGAEDPPFFESRAMVVSGSLPCPPPSKIHQQQLRALEKRIMEVPTPSTVDRVQPHAQSLDHAGNLSRIFTPSQKLPNPLNDVRKRMQDRKRRGAPGVQGLFQRRFSDCTFPFIHLRASNAEPTGVKPSACWTASNPAEVKNSQAEAAGADPPGLC